ncbi:ATP-dependent DNA ligase [Rhizobium sp. BK313]|uniref:ATP-dependent DNA ligase n=1 Tax=Rhizobium sp. BK313 TaxID=2587081 RepID=UPI00105EF243|nr:ATP-dependent DNA ligase [Rhizobium sp. BK313]MBB3452755.1 ATP-dependent DNA ligase [Rhizobium sp. BK313]
MAKSSDAQEFGLPLDLEPMEAKSADELPNEEGWQFEPKWDGFRCLAFKEGDVVDIRAKSGKPLGRYFPEILSLLRGLPLERFVVDGELVIELEGRLSFEAMQMRLHPAESRIRKLSASTPAKLVLFDFLLSPDGTSYVDELLANRRPSLERVMNPHLKPAELVLSPFTTDIEQARRWLLEAGNGGTDGVVCKRLDGKYEVGTRAMVKVKRLRTADCVVGGFRYSTKSKEVGSLLLGLYNEEGELDHVGFTSTISDAERKVLTRKLEALRGPPGFTGKAPGGPSRWSTERTGEWEPLKLELVVEVRFDHVTGHRFRHGTMLMRWRPDKKPSQCRFDQIEQAVPRDPTS